MSNPYEKLAWGNSAAGDRFSIPSHQASHNALVPALPWWKCWKPVIYSPVHAVIVPASRPAVNLRHAIGVARRAKCKLVVICSGETDPDEAYREASRFLQNHQIIVIPLPAKWKIPGLELVADKSELFSDRESDTATKRNLGLMLARKLRWRRVLFLDDDVRGFGRRQERQVMAGLARAEKGTVHAVGWAFDKFPDNSLVCHAYRLAGGSQGTFIGGGALGVAVEKGTPYFPRVYNEDWLFMLPLMMRKCVRLTYAGVLRQTVFDPFNLPEHAERQEAGDVLAEGLFRLLHRGRDISRARSSEYWRRQLESRSVLITSTKGRLSEKGVHLPSDSAQGELVARACAALDFALTVSGKSLTWPELLARWVVSWEADSKRWSRFFDALDGSSNDPPSVETYLGSLDLSMVPANARSRGRVAAAPFVLLDAARADNKSKVPRWYGWSEWNKRRLHRLVAKSPAVSKGAPQRDARPVAPSIGAASH